MKSWSDLGGSIEIEEPVITHVGFLAKSAEKMVKKMQEFPGSHDWKLYKMDFTKEVMDIGGTYEMKIALGKIGDTYYEVLEFLKGPGSYFDWWWKNIGIEGVHHICYTFPKYYEKVVEQLLNDGYKYLLKGHGDFNFCYLQPKNGGLVIELGKEYVNRESIKNFEI